MENLSNVDDQNEQLHPKPNEDPGAGIETVIPDSKKESLPNDKSNTSENTKDKGVTDSDDNENTAPKGQETNLESNGTAAKDPETSQDKDDGDSPDIETVTP